MIAAQRVRRGHDRRVGVVAGEVGVCLNGVPLSVPAERGAHAVAVPGGQGGEMHQLDIRRGGAARQILDHTCTGLIGPGEASEALAGRQAGGDVLGERLIETGTDFLEDQPDGITLRDNQVRGQRGTQQRAAAVAGRGVRAGGGGQRAGANQHLEAGAGPPQPELDGVAAGIVAELNTLPGPGGQALGCLAQVELGVLLLEMTGLVLARVVASLTVGGDDLGGADIRAGRQRGNQRDCQRQCCYRCQCPSTDRSQWISPRPTRFCMICLAIMAGHLYDGQGITRVYLTAEPDQLWNISGPVWYIAPSGRPPWRAAARLAITARTARTAKTSTVRRI